MPVTSFSPISGPVKGGISIFITGTNFNDPTTVTIGGMPAIVIYYSKEYIIAVTPAGSPGEKEVIVNGETLSTFFTYISTPMPYNNICVNPAYNATNFTPGNPQIFNTLKSYANLPNYPLNTGTDANQIYLSRQNISYFNEINQQTMNVKNSNSNLKQYPQFKSDSERLMYLQGQTLLAARNKMLGQPQSTIYNIINPDT